MAKLGEFINSIALKAGIKPDDKNLISVLSTQGLSEMQIPDDIAGHIDNSLISMEVAQKGHPALFSHYYARAYNGLDASLDELMNENEFDPESIAAMKAETSSTKRAKLVANKIKELTAAKANASAPDKTKIAAEIAQLNGLLADEKKLKAELTKQYESQIRSIKVNQQLNTLLTKYKTVYDDLDPDAKDAAVNAIINKNLQEKNAEFTFNESGALDIRTKDGMGVFGSNNIQLNPQGFLDTALTKILKQTENPGQQIPGGGNIQTTPPRGQQSANIGVNPSLAAAIAQSRSSYDASQKVMT